ncbi:MAG: lipopolysaccharide transport periplasmic protein LptA [Proteobacteria bacterium]|nr:lipopolysaccharide transport periplasmic protein LptA [Pseudomonadota bacterium]
MPRLNPNAIAVALLCALASPFSHSLPEDREQAIHISADKATRDEKKGLTIYSGNVILDQGSLHISADRITVFRIVEEGDKIVAKGQPALVQQQPNAGEELMRAHANIIEYYKSEDRLRLHSGAQIKQGASTVKGETIDYYISQQLIKAVSDQSQEDSRVEVVIPASRLEKSEGESDQTDGK